jgi:hypothetical protein
MQATIPNCLHCKNYFITHDPAAPYGCRAMAFKSQKNPARLVYETSGIICQFYAPKQTTKNVTQSPKTA